MANWQEIKTFWLYSLFQCLAMATKALQDNRCYLENGASSETFFVPEDLSVGDIVGRVRVIGEPRPLNGSIALRLRESDSPITIGPGSKNLTLRRPLDKEGIDGPSSVFVSLICERLGSPDPGFVIPINIRVTDANDNAPVFINAPYVLNISEVTIVGTRVLQGVHAIDNDQQGPFSSVRSNATVGEPPPRIYSVLSGPHSDFFEFENELEGTLVLEKPLDYETLKKFDINIRAQDHGNPPQSTDTVLTVHVMDADDQNPRFLDDKYTATIPEFSHEGANLVISPRDIRAFDQDEGIGAPIIYTWNGIGSEYALFRLDRQTGKISLGKSFHEHDLQTSAILVIRAAQQDNPDRYALATLTVTRDFVIGIKFLKAVFNIRASESLASGSVIGTLTNNRPGHHLKYFVSDQSILKTFAINTFGELSLKREIDYEYKQEYVFKVFATDGITNDSSTVNITVENVNEWEPRFRYANYEFFADMSSGTYDLVGRVEAADGDRGDRLIFSLNGPDAHKFFITSKGELRIRDVADLQGSTAILTVTATDSGDPPKKASVPVKVHFSGSNSDSPAGIVENHSFGGASVLLAGLGTVLLLLSLVVGLLIAYVCKVKRTCRESSPLTEESKQVSNPVFAKDKTVSGTAAALCVIPSQSKSMITSSKVQPALPVNVLWPPTAARVKKLSWGDKTESGSTGNLNDIDISKVLESSNITVYF